MKPSKSFLFTSVTLKVRGQTAVGQQIMVVGDCPSLGSWQTENAIALHTSASQYPTWSAKVRIPAKLAVEYKYIVRGAGDNVIWEPFEGNRMLHPTGGDLIVDDGEFGKNESDPMAELPRKVFDLQAAPTASSLNDAECAPRPTDVIMQDGTVTAELDEKKTVLFVRFRLPLLGRRNPQTGRLEFMWNHVSLHSTINSLRRGLEEVYSVIWIGTLDVEVRPHEQDAVSKMLFDRFGCVPVYGSPEVLQKSFRFCKGILWPVFHHVVEIKEQKQLLDEDDCWKAYCLVNNLFAQKVCEVHKEDYLIWIHDYHLFLLALYLRRRIAFHRAAIGFFLHTPFPSSEIYRMLPMRDDILHGLLSASLLGFQTFEYTRHFLTACKRLLGVEYSVKRGGLLAIEHNGRHVTIRIAHIGIDPEIVASRLLKDEVRASVDAMRQKYARFRVLAGIDTLTRLKGVGLKLLAMAAFLRKNPESRDVVLVQICHSPKKYISRDDSALSAANKALVAQINTEFGNANYQPIVYVEQDVTYDQRVSLLSIADALIVTSVRDGLNTLPMEYIAARKSAGRGMLVLSEFMAYSRSLRSIVRVNPLSGDDVARGIQTALSVPLEEQRLRHEYDNDYIEHNTTTSWALDLLHDLDVAQQDAPNSSFLGFGLGTGFRVLEFSANFQHLDIPVLMHAYTNSRNRLFFLDYEGTLCPQQKSDLSVHAPPSKELLDILRRLCEVSSNTVFLVVARPRAILEEWFGHIEGLGLAAEHGFFIRWPHSKEWLQLIPEADFSWMSVAVSVCETYAERTDGSFLDVRDSSVVWSFDDVEHEFGQWQSKELYDHLQSVLALFDASVTLSDTLVEIKSKWVNKGVAAEQILQDYHGWISSFATNPQTCPREPDFILSLGNDRYDEDLFSLLSVRYPKADSPSIGSVHHKISKSNSGNRISTSLYGMQSSPRPSGSMLVGMGAEQHAPPPSSHHEPHDSGEPHPDVFTCIVGPKPSRASSYLGSPEEAVDLLSTLLSSGSAHHHHHHLHGHMGGHPGGVLRAASSMNLRNRTSSDMAW